MKAMWSGHLIASITAPETRYFAIGGREGGSTTEAENYVPIPHDCTLTYWRLVLSQAPGGSNQRDFWLCINGTQNEDTKLHYKGGTVDSVATFSVALSEGDTLSIKEEGSGPTYPAVADVQFVIDYETAESNTSIVFGGTNSPSTTTGLFYTPTGYVAGQTTELKVISKSPGTFTLSHLYIVASGAPGAGTSFTITTRKGSEGGSLSNQSLVVAIANTATSGSDTSNTISLVAGDNFDFVYTNSGSPANPYWHTGMLVTANTDGDFMYCFSSTVYLPRYPFGTGLGYSFVCGNGDIGTPIYLFTVNFVTDVIVKSMYIEQTTTTPYGIYTYILQKALDDTVFSFLMDAIYFGHVDNMLNVLEPGGFNYKIFLSSGTQISTGYFAALGLLLNKIEVKRTVHIKGKTLIIGNTLIK